MQDVTLKTPDGYEFVTFDFISEVLKDEHWKSFGTHSKPAS